MERAWNRHTWQPALAFGTYWVCSSRAEVGRADTHVSALGLASLWGHFQSCMALGDLDLPTLSMIECSEVQSKTFQRILVFGGTKPARSHRGRG